MLRYKLEHVCIVILFCHVVVNVQRLKVTKYIYSSTVLMLLSTSTPLYSRGKYCTFHFTTLLSCFVSDLDFILKETYG